MYINTTTKLRGTHLLRFFISSLVVVVIIFIGALVTPAIERQLTLWKLLPQSEQLAVLAMENPQHLPTSYTPGTAITFGFYVQNAYQTTKTYRYTISETNQAGDQIAVLGTGTITLLANQTKNTTLSVTPVAQGQHSYIHIAISNGEQVGFWVKQVKE